jgi:hypothetical protein
MGRSDSPHTPNGQGQCAVLPQRSLRRVAPAPTRFTVWLGIYGVPNDNRRMSGFQPSLEGRGTALAVDEWWQNVEFG